MTEVEHMTEVLKFNKKERRVRKNHQGKGGKI
jgi:hypothetical protein